MIFIYILAITLKGALDSTYHIYSDSSVACEAARRAKLDDRVDWARVQSIESNIMSGYATLVTVQCPSEGKPKECK